MIEQMYKIRSQFDEIAKDREALRLRESDGARRLNNRILRPTTGHMVDETSMFGRDAEVMDVINLLLSEKENPFSVISIIGKGGLGKTTIAQLVYNDKIVCQSFDLFGWVCVSEEFDIRILMKTTIESVSKMNCDLSGLSPLQEEVVKIVKGKRLLLVLDDVWNEEQSFWEMFQIPFKVAKQVRILVTTRNGKVVKAVQTTACFRPSYLPENSCWQLFRHYAFSNISSTVPTHFAEMGRDIMRKCGGLPLAVKSIASLLRHEIHEDSWRQILENDLWESNPSNDIFPALQISYDHLPAHLKPCLLLCSMYRKDYPIQKDNLIELWISHGYIESRGKRRITEIGVEYYEELKERSFLDHFSDKFSEHCKLHDIIHNLARLNSANEHYSVEINQPLNIQEGNILREAYHLYATGFMGYLNQIPQQNLKGLRTFSAHLRGCIGVFEHRYCIESTEAMDPNLQLPADYRVCGGHTTMFNLAKYEALRVLELNGYRLKAIPDCISQLKHLSYLRISSNDLQMLPISIGLLYNLQTFILDCYNSPLKYLPESIGHLANLWYLCIKCEVKLLPRSLCSLANLLRLVIESNYLEEIPSDLGRLGYLEELTIGSQRIQALPDSIGCLSSLMKLNLSLGDSFQELPTAIGNFQKLKTLRVCNRIHFPFNYSPHGHENFPGMRTMAACLRVRTIGWLKDMKNLEGVLIIEGLGNINNLVDAQHANLRKCKIETLVLRWHNDHEHSIPVPKELKISLIEETDEGRVVGGDVSFGLLECLQPQPHLKKLVLQGYPSDEVPSWMGDPFSVQAIQEIILLGCNSLHSLPFSNLHTLRHLQVHDCSSIRFLSLEQLPSQLENLKISWCEELELITGLWNLGMLVTLEIAFCEALRSITMDELQLAESTEPLGNFSHERPHDDGQKNTSSLTRLKFLRCPLLRALPYQLISSVPCNVWVHGCGCPDLESGDPFVPDG
jgi:Leucine-rich repeat (LRR) protein